MSVSKPKVRLVGSVPGKIWGLSFQEWQRRAWQKAGVAGVCEEADVLVGTDWILSPALQRGLIARPGTALLISDEATGDARVAAIHLSEGSPDQRAAAAACISKPHDAGALAALGVEPAGMQDLASGYDAALRKSEAPYALSVYTTAPRDIERRQFKGSYKGVTDLVTKYVWPWPAFHVTRWTAAAGISPNTVTTLSLVLVIIAFCLFWVGAWFGAIAAAWAMTFLDTVDGKLARTTMTYSRWGNLYDHGIDLIHPPFWYWAMYQGLLANGTQVPQPVLLAALFIIVAGYILNRLQEGAFITRFGFHIHVWRPVDSFMREITARRNPNLLIFSIAALTGLAGAGFVAVAAWTLICLVFHGVRLIQAMMSRAPVKAWLAA